MKKKKSLSKKATKKSIMSINLGKNNSSKTSLRKRKRTLLRKSKRALLRKSKRTLLRLTWPKAFSLTFLRELDSEMDSTSRKQREKT